MEGGRVGNSVSFRHLNSAHFFFSGVDLSASLDRSQVFETLRL